MNKFTQTRRDWNDLDLAQRMLRAGRDGYRSLYQDAEWDTYFLISTASEKQLKENYTNEDLENIFEELESLGTKESKEFTVSSGEVVLLYWEIDRFSK